jgi:diadenosine tetraphosphate (Ap4A) HIT family hydrolase
MQSWSCPGATAAPADPAGAIRVATATRVWFHGGQRCPSPAKWAPSRSLVQRQESTSLSFPMASCHICSDNASQDIGEEMWGAARLTSGYVRLNPNQYFRGSCFFLAKSCIHELHDLDRTTRDAHLAEMAEVAAAIWSVFSPKKLNYEALGNGAPHLHWWLTPRY